MNVDYNTLAVEYARHRRVHQPLLAALLKEGQLSAASQVLEVGCGTGNYIHAIADIIGCTCYGSDPSKGMLEKAQTQGPGVNFSLGSAEQLDSPESAFDLVFCVDVIHHVNDRLAFFREVQRVLKPGGKLCVATDSEEIIRKRKPLSNYFPETIPQELKRYPPIPGLKSGLAAAGFDPIYEAGVEQAATTDDIQIYRDKGFSCLHIIPQAAFERGLQKLEADLRSGPIETFSSYLLIWGIKP
jgi:ubiquinone/menaquinone biosynthesis C-methylase UbiE